MRIPRLMTALTVLLLTAPSAAGAVLTSPTRLEPGRTTVLAGWVDGREHLVVGFQPRASRYVAVVPLPGKPVSFRSADTWALDRLALDLRDRRRPRGKQDAAHVRIMHGSASDVARELARSNVNTPDASRAVLERYGVRDFGIVVLEPGQGGAAHFVVEVANPWVPVRALTIGRDTAESDVFLLTPAKPALLPAEAIGWNLKSRARGSESLLEDMRSDPGMSWVPETNMWLTHLTLSAPSAQVQFDLATDISGNGAPSWELAGRPTAAMLGLDPVQRPTDPRVMVTPRVLDPAAQPTPLVLAAQRQTPQRTPLVAVAFIGVLVAAGALIWLLRTSLCIRFP